MQFEYNHIVLSDDPTLLEEGNETSSEDLHVLFCVGGYVRMRIDGITREAGEGTLAMILPKTVVEDVEPSPGGKSVTVCAPKASLDSAITRLLHSESQWWEKLAYLRNNPVIHPNEQQVKILVAYAHLLHLMVIDDPTPGRSLVMSMLGNMTIFELLNMMDSFIPQSADNKDITLSHKEILLHNFYALLTIEGIARHPVSWYADRLSVTPKYLTTVCSEISGESASALIHKALISEISGLLHSTSLDLKEIASRTGFAELSEFCRYVKRYTGMTPLEYRRTPEA